MACGADDRPPRLQASEHEGKEFSRAFPSASAEFQAAEDDAREGRLSAAAEKYRTLKVALPQCALAFRRSCEVLSDLGRRAEALEACEKAAFYGQDVIDLRAKVGALMAGDEVPPYADFVAASQMAIGIHERMAHRLEGHAAFFDIARRLGDQRMMQSLFEDLKAVDPKHPETQRAAYFLAKAVPSRWRLWGGCAVLVVLAFGTVSKMRRNLRVARVDILDRKAATAR